MIRRLTIAVAVVWACACGVHGLVPYAVELQVARAATPVQHITLTGNPPIVAEAIAGHLYFCGVWGNPRASLVLKCVPAPRAAKPKLAARPKTGPLAA